MWDLCSPEMMFHYNYIYDNYFQDDVFNGLGDGQITGVFKHTINFKINNNTYSIQCGQKKSLSAYFLYIEELTSFEPFGFKIDDSIDVSIFKINIRNNTINLGLGKLYKPKRILCDQIKVGSRVWFMELIRDLTVNGLSGYILKIPFGLNVIDTYLYQVLESGDLKKVIGIGFGLTPSGDDFLCGYYTALTMINNKTLKTEVVKNAIEENWYKINDVSRQQYSICFINRMSEVHLQFTKSLIEDRKREGEMYFKKLKKYGHSSGTDFAIGVAYALIEEEIMHV